MEEKIIELRGCRFHTVISKSTTAVANILMVHGFGEHIGRYAEMMQVFENLQLNVYGYDRRGEGQSEGRSAYIHSMDDQVNDFLKIKEQMISNQLPTYIYAHSLGGLVVTKYFIDHKHKDIAGVILSGALLKVDDDISPLLQKVSGIVAAILPTLQTVKVDTNLLSRNPKVKPAYEADPYVYQGGTPARTGNEILKSTAYVQNHFSNISLPILITHGGADKLADPKGSKMMYDKISSTDKTLKIFDGLYHEIMHEPEKQLVFDTISQWLQDRLAAI